MLHHQKAPDGNEKLARGMAPHLPAAGNVDEWHYLTQLNQARAVTFGIEHHRALWPHCMGAIVWQLNDCWPVTSWSAIDGDGRRKPLWYALRRAFDDRLLTVRPAGDTQSLEVVVINDSSAAWAGQLQVTRFSVAGKELAQERHAIKVGARSRHVIVLTEPLTNPADPNRELIVAELDDRRTIHFFAEDVRVAFDVPELDIAVADVDGGVEVHVTARTLLRDLMLAADRVDPGCEVDTQIVTLLPGETHRFMVSTTVAASDPRWYEPTVLYCVNGMRDAHRRPSTVSPHQA